jgi:hypothetical protein
MRRRRAGDRGRSLIGSAKVAPAQQHPRVSVEPKINIIFSDSAALRWIKPGDTYGWKVSPNGAPAITARTATERFKPSVTCAAGLAVSAK